MESAWISSRIRSPSAAYTNWCRCTRLLPANAGETTKAWKCWPSPTTSRCSQARPAAMPAFTLSGSTISMPEFVSGLQKFQGQQRYDKKTRPDHRQAGERRKVRAAEKAIAEAVDHVEEGIGVRQALPEFGQRADRIEHAREEGERQ